MIATETEKVTLLRQIRADITGLTWILDTMEAYPKYTEVDVLRALADHKRNMANLELSNAKV